MERPFSSALVAEAYGAFLLTFIGCTAITIANDASLFSLGPTLGLGFIGLAFGVALMIGIASVGSVSGGHFNPAVTVALLAAGRFPRKRVPGYIAAQFVGATVAALLELALVGMAAASTPGVDLGSSLPNGSLPSPIFASVLAEIIGTAVLAMVVLGSTDSASSGNVWGTMSIGLAITVSIWAVGSISGASLNPARSFGPAVVSLLFDSTPMLNYWIYVIGPILGALLAANLYRFIFRQVKPDEIPATTTT
ncbi:MAG: aquaporin family protein [Thaumarchaeota archaeon]|nr:aquaporin family protein [Nitrososphaerota archaeon]